MSLQTSMMGMRYAEGREVTLLSYGANTLFKILYDRHQADLEKREHKGVILKPVLKPSVFHGMNPAAQIYSLKNTIWMFFSPHHQEQMTQMHNAALEAVYSCIFNKISQELDAGHKMNRGSMRQHLYNMWQNYYDGNGSPLVPQSATKADWLNAVDKVAMKHVWAQDYAVKNFALGEPINPTDEGFAEAVGYLTELTW